MRTFMSFHTAKFTEVIRKIKGTHLTVKISHGRDNVKSSMQSSAGKEIEIRAALSSPCPAGKISVRFQRPKDKRWFGSVPNYRVRVNSK